MDEKDKLLQQAITLLERSRDRLLYKSEERVTAKEIDAFIKRCALSINNKTPAAITPATHGRCQTSQERE